LAEPEIAGAFTLSGGVMTVNVAALVGTSGFTELDPTKRYSLPDCDAVTALRASVPEVAPVMLVQVCPPSVETCHWMLGDGLPVKAAVNVAVVPTGTD
jgi:hypothetical protein